MSPKIRLDLPGVSLSAQEILCWSLGFSIWRVGFHPDHDLDDVEVIHPEAEGSRERPSRYCGKTYAGQI